jgi:zinc/manganese transport system substrate-binding protein
LSGLDRRHGPRERLLARPARRSLVFAAALAALAAGSAGSGCGRSGPPPVKAAGTPGPRFTVLAAENFWGSLASQLAGTRAAVSSVVVDPDADPHTYQPSAVVARRIAGANMVIVNGLGYDEWAEQLLRASPASSRVVLNVGEELRLPAGSNPHRWYYPHDVRAVIAAIVAGYDRLDPAGAGYFAARRHLLETRGLARYDALRSQIRSRYRGVPVGYSESVFQGLGEDLGLELTTPPSFARAVAEGTDVTAGDRRTVDEQARRRLIAVWVFNSQNVTPDVQRVNELARAAGVPVSTVTETLSPEGRSFQAWQTAQLERLAAALHAGTGR